MKAPKPVSQTLLPWLKANLGPRCLAPLTGTDSKALLAAVQVVDLYSYDPSRSALVAFGACVMSMQPSVRYLAYHAIAHVMDWSDRNRVWELADLGYRGQIPLCAHEPGGSAR